MPHFSPMRDSSPIAQMTRSRCHPKDTQTDYKFCFDRRELSNVTGRPRDSLAAISRLGVRQPPQAHQHARRPCRRPRDSIDTRVTASMATVVLVCALGRRHPWPPGVPMGRRTCGPLRSSTITSTCLTAICGSLVSSATREANRYAPILLSLTSVHLKYIDESMKYL